MPKIDEIIATSKKKFKKSEYRPWNYMEEIEKEQSNDTGIIKESNRDQKLSVPVVLNDIEYQKDNKIPFHINSSLQKRQLPLEEAKTLVDQIIRLAGHQKIIFLFIVDRCIARGALITDIITGEILTSITRTTLKMVKTSINRLIKKNLIEREKGKPGRGGFYIFSISSQVQSATIEAKKLFPQFYIDINQESYNNQSGAKLYKPIKTSIIDDLPLEWQRINFEPLINIGFSENQLFQLYEKQLNSPEIIQESIYRFAFGLEHNENLKKYDNPLNVLMGVLRKGSRWVEPNYESAQDKALRELIEEGKRKEAKRLTLIEELFETEFPSWELTLNEEELKSILPEEVSKSGVKGWIKSTLKTYYRDKILIPRLKSLGVFSE